MYLNIIKHVCYHIRDMKSLFKASKLLQGRLELSSVLSDW
jgi:hypothetical protein